MGLGKTILRRAKVCCAAAALCVPLTSALASGTSGADTGSQSASTSMSRPSGADTVSQSDWTAMGAPFANDWPQSPRSSVSCVNSTFCMSVGAVGDKNQPSGTAPADEWNGTSWIHTSLPVATTENPSTPAQAISVSCTSDTFCLAVGSIPPTNGAFATGILVDRWDGSSWTSLPGPSTNQGVVASAVDCLSTVACIVVGSNDGPPLTVEWDGTNWSAMPNAAVAKDWFQSVSCPDVSDCMAVGWNIDGTLASARWDGSEWSNVTIPNEATGTEAELLTSVSCLTPSSCVAAGWHSFSVTPTSGGEAPIVDSWDGTTWSPEPLPIDLVAGLDDELNSVDCYAPGRCIAVGGAGTPSALDPPPLVLSSDNGTWSVVEDPPMDQSGEDNVLQSISCVSGWSCVTAGLASTQVGVAVFYADAPDTGPSAPIAEISSPIDGQVFATGSAATTRFSCSPGLDDPGLSSCVDSNGSADPQALDTSTRGVHSFAVTATSQDGRSATATVHYLVADPPSTTIGGLDGGETFGLGQVVPTNFACADGANGPGIFLCRDSSTSPGELDTSTAGPHSYEVMALSQDGLFTVTTVDYTVVSASAPTSTITAPTPTSTSEPVPLYVQNQVVPTAFACAEGAGGPGIASCADSNGSASPGQLDTSQPGPHTYTVTATSQDGVAVTSSFTYIVAAPPTAQVTLPTDGMTFQIGQSVSTNFGCTDGVGGPGIATCVDVTGSRSPGALDTSTLGSQTYSVTATSKDGQSGAASIEYTVVPTDSNSTPTTTTPTTTITSATTTTPATTTTTIQK